jgi:hypothetical protein
MALVPLHGKRGSGKFAIVDAADLPFVSGYRWHLTKDGYVYARPYLGNYCKATIYMQQLVLPALKGFERDHKNRNKLDNRSHNLRVATISQNRANKSIKPGCLRGVVKEPRASTWRARIKVARKTLCLGNFKTAQEAAVAYNEAATRHFGAFAVLNDI